MGLTQSSDPWAKQNRQLSPGLLHLKNGRNRFLPSRRLLSEAGVY